MSVSRTDIIKDHVFFSIKELRSLFSQQGTLLMLHIFCCRKRSCTTLRPTKCLKRSATEKERAVRSWVGFFRVKMEKRHLVGLCGREIRKVTSCSLQRDGSVVLFKPDVPPPVCPKKVQNSKLDFIINDATFRCGPYTC